MIFRIANTLILLGLSLMLKAQVFTILDTVPSNHCYEVRLVDSTRVSAHFMGITLDNFDNSNFIGGSGFSRYANCFHNNSRFIAMELLSNGSYVGLFQYDESCRPEAVVMIIVDANGNLVSEHYLEDYTYNSGGSIIDDNGTFHTYIQLGAGTNLFEMRHLTFDYSGNLLDSASSTQSRNLYGGGAYRANRYLKVQDSILLSFWDAPFNMNTKLAMFDKDLSSSRIILDYPDLTVSNFALNNDTITAMSGTQLSNGDVRGGLLQTDIAGSFLKKNHPSSNAFMDFIQIGNYYVVSEYVSNPNIDYKKFLVFNKNLDIIYSIDAPDYGRFTAITDTSFILYKPARTSINYIVEVNLDALKALDPLVGIEHATNDNQQLTIYPNPTSSILNINFEQAQEVTIGVYSLTGALLLERNVNTQNAQLDVSGLPKGMYLVRVSAAQGIESQKVVISR